MAHESIAVMARHPEMKLTYDLPQGDRLYRPSTIDQLMSRIYSARRAFRVDFYRETPANFYERFRILRRPGHHGDHTYFTSLRAAEDLDWIDYNTQ